MSATRLGAAVMVVIVGACDVERAPKSLQSGTVEHGDTPLPGGHLPANGPERFGFGSDATAARVALWDIDVKPDGEGLPPGSGTVAAGRALYEVECMACHGPTGQEGPNDRLAGARPWSQWPDGRVFGSYWPYASTLFDYTRRAMPQTKPGSLTADELYSVVGYVLYLNGLVAEDAVLDSASLATIEMPARDRFVPDDRRGGVEIR